MKCGKLLRTLKIGENYQLKRVRKYGGVKVYVEVERGRDAKESVIVISSENSGQILKEYKQRWKIETLFQNLKSRGFELEETHLTEAAKIDKLFGVLALAAGWQSKQVSWKVRKIQSRSRKTADRKKVCSDSDAKLSKKSCLKSNAIQR